MITALDALSITGYPIFYGCIIIINYSVYLNNFAAIYRHN